VRSLTKLVSSLCEPLNLGVQLFVQRQEVLESGTLQLLVGRFGKGGRSLLNTLTRCVVDQSLQGALRVAVGGTHNVLDLLVDVLEGCWLDRPLDLGCLSKNFLRPSTLSTASRY